jgi:uncharacterized membrane protein YfcA
MNLSAVDIIAALVITFAAALAQGLVGVGFAVVSVPLLSLINPALAPVPQLLVVLPLTLVMGLRERHHAEFSEVTWVLIGRIPGAAIGVALVLVATQRTLDVLIASLVLVGVAIRARNISVARGPATDLLVGTFAGVSSMVASMGGPPTALLFHDRGPETVRASLAFVFTVGLVLTIVVRSLAGLISADDMRIAMMIFPAMVLGYLASVPLSSRVGEVFVRRSILVVSTTAAVGLLIKAL